ncbi:MAG: 3-deoxy-manno-octulosonate cytidylyltransferase [Chlamydiales bacterium]|nr:3-deoxy-manno-octulosonate cytidylyltransferase [Chlamydiales bacterium]MCH9635219.1 3-deoxy-manno-octulosonate cytidylyltransferase [Chlamydiales bacterium]MCH9704379.1 3-deoxy-manno-octulosonate cytidylyltransferase [Chlamydiota bacterium]
MLKIVGVIPARLASTRFPRKVLKEIEGKSLLQMTYENTIQSGVLQRVVIAAEDEEIVEHAQKFGAEAYLTDMHPSGTDRVAQVVQDQLDEADIVVNVQADEPCLNPAVIDTLVGSLYEDPEAVATTAITKIRNPRDIFDPSTVKCVFDDSMRALYFSRSPIPYPQKEQDLVDHYRHIGVYCFRKQFLLQYAMMQRGRLGRAEDLEQLKILEHGHPLHVCVVEDQLCGVDTPKDLETIQEYICRNTSSSQEALSPR